MARCQPLTSTDVLDNGQFLEEQFDWSAGLFYLYEKRWRDFDVFLSDFLSKANTITLFPSMDAKMYDNAGR